jgi:phosphoglycerate dehydrogenase-like enzyme
MAGRLKIVWWQRMSFVEAALTKLFAAEPDVDVTVVKSIDELEQALPGADGLVAIDTSKDLAPKVGELLRAPTTTLRWLHVISAGREGFEIAGVPASITMTGAAGAHSPVLAEHVMAFFLAFTRRTSEFEAMTAKHEWDRSITSRMTSVEGQTLAIIGLGHAGQQLAKRARAFGMNVIAATRTPKNDPNVDDIVPLSKLHDVLARADFIAMTIAQTADTYHLIGAPEFAVCKPSAYLVNIGRGGTIDQAALLDALRTGKIAGAGLDVTDPEPLPPDDPLWNAPNLSISPHCAGGTSALSQKRLAERVIENLAKLRNGTLVPT